MENRNSELPVLSSQKELPEPSKHQLVGQVDSGEGLVANSMTRATELAQPPIVAPEKSPATAQQPHRRQH